MANLSALNVKDFGAVGDNSHDDTPNIQAAFDAAWGPIDNANGALNADKNIPLFFPPGNYLVKAPTNLTITNIAENGVYSPTSLMRVTVAEDISALSYGTYKTGHYVFIVGVVGTQVGVGGAALGTDFFANAVNTPHGITIIDNHNFDLTMPHGKPGPLATFNGSISAGVLTLTSAVTGTIAQNQGLFGSGVATDTIVGTNIDSTHWNVSSVSAPSQVVGPVAMVSDFRGWWNSKTDGVHYDNGSFDAVATSTNGIVSTAALHIRNVNSALMYGAGRQACGISCQDGSCLSINGMGFSRIENMTFSCPLAVFGPIATAFNLNWDETPQYSEASNDFQSNQSNTILNCQFSGGLRTIIHGWGGGMTSETCFYNNFISNTGHAATNLAGIYIGNQNSLGVSIIGGNLDSNGIAIWIAEGAVESIMGVNFQESNQWDIRIDNSQGDATLVSGCRSESAQFLWTQGGGGVHVSACSQPGGGVAPFSFVRSDAAGDLTTNTGMTTIQNCWSNCDAIRGNGLISILGSRTKSGYATMLSTLDPGARVIQFVTEPLTIATLPTAASYLTGTRSMITNGVASPTWGAAVSTTGSTLQPVYCDGTTWRYG